MSEELERREGSRGSGDLHVGGLTHLGGHLLARHGDPDGRVERIRMLAATRLLGERTVIIAQPAFTSRHGAVMLALSAEELHGLPAAMTLDGAAQ